MMIDNGNSLYGQYLAIFFYGNEIYILEDEKGFLKKIVKNKTYNLIW